MSMQTFDETLVSLTSAATAVANTLTETIMVPDYTFPANYFYQGRTIRGTIMGQVSNVVTAVPTLTFRIRMGAATLGTVLVSDVGTCNATANTNLTWRKEFTLTCQTSGTAGTAMCMGIHWMPQLTAGAAVGQVAYPNLFPNSAPVTAAINTTIPLILSISEQWSAANAANSIQALQYVLEALT